MVKYHLGCGGTIKPGMVNVDGYSPKADIRANVLTMDYKPCDVIESHHMFEHFGYVNSFVLLIKWTLALVVNGHLIIDVPDPAGIAEAMTNGNNRRARAAMRLMFGSHEHDQWAFHINGWTESLFRDTLTLLGYKVTGIRKYGAPVGDFPHMGIEVVARKVRSISKSALITTAKTLLKDYTHPSETVLYRCYCDQLSKALS